MMTRTGGEDRAAKELRSITALTVSRKTGAPVKMLHNRRQNTKSYERGTPQKRSRFFDIYNMKKTKRSHSSRTMASKTRL